MLSIFQFAFFFNLFSPLNLEGELEDLGFDKYRDDQVALLEVVSVIGKPMIGL